MYKYLTNDSMLVVIWLCMCLCDCWLSAIVMNNVDEYWRWVFDEADFVTVCVSDTQFYLQIMFNWRLYFGLNLSSFR